MKLIRQIKQRLQNMRTLSNLLTEAERVANETGESAVGSEHIIVAAFTLPDRTARRVFESLNVDPDSYSTAIAKQQKVDLEQLGIDTTELNLHQEDIAVNKSRLPSGNASSQKLLHDMAKSSSFSDAKPLIGADVLVAVANQKHGIAISALELLGIDPAMLKKAALQEQVAD